MNQVTRPRRSQLVLLAVTGLLPSCAADQVERQTQLALQAQSETAAERERCQQLEAQLEEARVRLADIQIEIQAVRSSDAATLYQQLQQSDATAEELRGELRAARGRAANEARVAEEVAARLEAINHKSEARKKEVVALKAELEKARDQARAGTAAVIESQIDGDFQGWEGETIVKLVNGQVWRQSDFQFKYQYAFMPEVLIVRSGSRYKMQVEGMDGWVYVTHLN